MRVSEGRFAVGIDRAAAGVALRRMQAGALATLLAGTAPAAAQVADLGGQTVQATVLDNFTPPGPGITPALITNGTLQLALAAPRSFAGRLDDSLGRFSLELNNSAALTLSGISLHSGQTRVDNARLIAGSTTALSANSVLFTIARPGNSTVVDLAGFSNSIDSLAGTGIITSSSGPAILTIAGGSSQSFRGALQGNLGLVKTGSSLQIFDNVDPVAAPTTATGPITLAGGSVGVGNGNPLGSGVITVIADSGLGAFQPGDLAIDNNIVINAPLSISTAANVTLNGTITGAGLMRTSDPAFALRLTNSNSNSGGLFLNGRLEIANAASPGTGTITAGFSARLRQIDPALSLTLVNGFDLSGAPIVIEAPSAGAMMTLAGPISGGGALRLESGAGTVLLAGNNTHSGPIDVGAGITLGVGRSAAVAAASAIRLGGGVTGLSFHGADAVVAPAIGALLGTGANTLVVDTRGFNATLAGPIGNSTGITGTLGMVKRGVGILTIANASTAPATRNMLFGGLEVAQGTLNLTGGLSGAVSVASDAVLAGTGRQTGGAVMMAADSILSPGNAAAGAGARGRLTLDSLLMTGGVLSLFDLGLPSIDVSGTANDIVIVTGNLGLAGILNVNALSGFSAGTYRLFSTGGVITGSKTLGAIPTGFGFSLVQGSNFLDLVVSGGDLYWDGTGPFGNNIVNGGDGVWDLFGTNWTNEAGANVSTYPNTLTGRAFFTNVGGNVTLAETLLYGTLEFTADGYLISPATAETLNSIGGLINVAAGATARIDAELSGLDGVIKGGPGRLVLGGPNSFEGDLVINAGTLALATPGAASAGAIRINGGAALGAATNALAIGNAVALFGAGEAAVEALAGQTITLASPVTGGAGVALAKNGAGTLVLTGANTHAGGTTLNAGTLTITSNASVGTGTLSGAGGTLLNVGTGPGAAPFTLANAVVLAGVMTLDLRGSSAGIDATGTYSTNGNDLTLNGPISGAGGLALQGGGRLFLNGANAHAGGTSIDNSAIFVGSNSALGTGSVAVGNGALGATGSRSLANAVQVAQRLSVIGGSDLAMSGPISGAGGITKHGATTLTLAGASSFAGGVDLRAGTLVAGSDTALGTGALAMGAGTTLRAGAPAVALANAVSLSAGAQVDAAGRLLTLAGVVSGGVPLAIIDSAGGGIVTLAGANTQAGTSVTNAAARVSADANLGAAGTGLALSGGRLITTASFASARGVTTAGSGGTVDVAAGTTLALSGPVSGTGLTKDGAGTLLLAGAANTQATTRLAAGTLQISGSGGLGSGPLVASGGTTLAAIASGLNIANSVELVGPGVLTVNGGDGAASFALSGPISGSGGLVKAGTGVLTLAGAGSYSGPTTVTAGTLNVTGGLVSAVTVNTGATLVGTGSIGALSVLAGGTVSPGAIGTAGAVNLAVAGPASLAGTYIVNISPTANDRITASGALSVGGALALAPTGTFTQFNAVYTLASGSSRTGIFSSVTGLDLFDSIFAPVVDYTPTAAILRLAPASLETLGRPLQGNPLETARAFDRATVAGYNPAPFLPLYRLRGQPLSAALRELSGEQRATERRMALDSTRLFRETAMDRINNGRAGVDGQQVSQASGDGTLSMFARVSGNWTTAETSGAATGFVAEQRGLLLGIDRVAGGLTAGGMFHYTATDIDYTVLGGRTSLETYGGTAYGGWRAADRGIAVGGGITIAGTSSRGNRGVTLAGIAQTLNGSMRGAVGQAFGEVALDVHAEADTRIEPFARLTHVVARIGPIAETGGIAALSAARQTSSITITNLGVRSSGRLAGGRVVLSGGASWQATTGDRDAGFQIGIPALGQTALIRAVAIDRHAGLFQADATFAANERLRLGLAYSGLMGNNNSEHSARFTLGWQF